jgi:hypothetical protein
MTIRNICSKQQQTSALFFGGHGVLDFRRALPSPQVVHDGMGRDELQQQG